VLTEDDETKWRMLRDNDGMNDIHGQWTCTEQQWYGFKVNGV